MRKSIAAFIVAVLVITAPGLPAYAGASAMISPGRAMSGITGNMPGLGHDFVSGTAGIKSFPVSLLQATLPTSLVPGIGIKPQSVARRGLLAVAGQPPASFTVSVQNKFSISPAVKSGPMPLAPLLEEKTTLSLSPDKVAGMSASTARTSAATIMDRILGIVPAAATADSESAVVGANSTLTAALPSARSAPSSIDIRSAVPGVASAAAVPGSAKSKLLGFASAIARMASGAGAVLGLQYLGAALLPAVFGLVPVAAIWAVSSGALLLPIALYARYRLSLRDSPRLVKIKWVMDGAIGAFLGAVAIAVPSLALVLSVESMAAVALPIVGLANAFIGRGGSGVLNSLMLWGTLAVLPAVMGVSAAGIIGLGPIVGMLTLPVMTSLSFFLGRIIYAAESGNPFAVPGSLQKMRFPVFQWVMTGVVFALMTGFSAVYSNPAFLAWQFLGEKTYAWRKGVSLWQNLLNNLLNFNTLYLGLLAFTAATGFASPLTFLVIAFAPERAARLAEFILGKLLPRSKPAPSTKVRPLSDPNALAEKPARWPNFYYGLKTALLIAGMAAIGVAMGAAVFGFASLGKNFAMAAVLAALPFFFSTWLIKSLMKTTPANEKDDPEFFGIMRELRERINAQRQAQGKKPIPMPEMVNDPMEAPNAYATGRSPFHALVGMTVGIKDMTLNPDSLRAGLIRLMAASEPEDKAFKAFRKAIAGSINGVSAAATPLEVAEAVSQASAEDLKKLGIRALRGVMAHEFSHVMDRHMLLGTVAGAISSGVAFASYGVLWAVGHAKAAGKKVMETVFPTEKPTGDPVFDRLLKRDRNIFNGMMVAGSLAVITTAALPFLAIFNVPVLVLASVAGIDLVAFVTCFILQRARERSKREMQDYISSWTRRAGLGFVEPVSTTAAALATLPAILRVFAALWVPIILQITQMASSRSNEGMADEDGAKLSQDPEALALALGLLTTWRPNFRFAIERLPFLAAMAHLYTVNPLEQLHKAGALPELDAATQWAAGVESKDDFLFNLFITHPDTHQRMERLYDMSEARDAGKKG